MDRKSWKECGGYIPTIHPRLPCGDPQVIFNFLSCNKKIKCADFAVFNLCGDISKTYLFFETKINYILEKNGIRYNQIKIVGNARHRFACDEWEYFRKLTSSLYLKPNREYSIDINYRDEFLKQKILFKSFLNKKFLLY